MNPCKAFRLSAIALIVVSVGLTFSTNTAVAASPGTPYFGFTPFPYDLTSESLDTTYNIVLPNSTMLGLHLDDGIPWDEALTNAPYPAKVQNEWQGWSMHIVPPKAIYLGLAPLEKDRVSLTHATGDNADEWANLPFNDQRVKTAYLNYAKRAVTLFKPNYLNLGIEAGELALRKPERWPSFVELYDFVRTALKAEYPNLNIGISFGLQSLMKPDVAKLVKPLVDNSDYLCLSFYPNMSAFNEKFGAPALPSGNNAWLEPMKWVRAYTDKPIAFCETGYSTAPVSVKAYGLQFSGDAVSQAAYLRDLIDTAQKENYAFVIWYLAIDYDKLYARLSDPTGVNQIWRNIGLLDGELKPKPAWALWQAAVLENKNPAVKGPSVAANSNPLPTLVAQPVATTVVPKTNGIILLNLQFSTSQDILTCGGGNQIVLENSDQNSASKNKLMRWGIDYQPGLWNWCVKNVDAGQLTGASQMIVRIRSDHEAPLFLKLEENDKESFYTIVTANNQWRDIDIKLADFKLDDSTRKNGMLDPGAVGNLILADPGSVNGLTGSRTIWIESIQFK